MDQEIWLLTIHKRETKRFKKRQGNVSGIVTSSKVDFTSQYYESLLYLKNYLKSERSRHVGREAMQPEISE